MSSSEGDSTDDMPLLQRINRANGRKRKSKESPKKNGKLRKKIVLNGDDSPVSESDNDYDDDDLPILERTGEKSRKQEALRVGSAPLNPVSNYQSTEVVPLVSEETGGKWWTLPPLPEGQKWQTLRHNGVLFPPPYKPHGVRMLYEGKPVDLTPEQEEIMTFYAVMLETDYLKNPKFRENFFKDWKKVLGKDHIIQKLEKCDFTPVYEWHLEVKAQKTNAHMTKEQRQLHNKKPEVIEAKQKAAEEKKRIEELHGYALVDGCREKVGNFRVEPPGLFRGRGDHPKTGKVKARVKPEDIVINIGERECLPKCPVEGHNWKGVVHNDKVTWLAYWTENINGSIKYVYLHSSSRFKGQSDMDKFEKARELHKHIKSIREKYMWGMGQTDDLVRQRATAMWIIDVLALRVGNEKSTEDEADTVGCCSLRVEHLQFRQPNFVQFDFLGKDSMRYLNEVPVIEPVFKNLRKFCANKQPTDQVFDRLSTAELNKYLNECMPGLSAKVFRTYNASITLEKELVKPTIDPTDEPIQVPKQTDTVPVKVFYYNRANREVAILCNHQRTVSKQFDSQMGRMDAKIADSEAKRDLLQSYLEACMNNKASSFANPPMKSQDPEKVQASLRTAETRLAKLKLDRKLKDDNKSVALGTSKINYMDPRITVAWCKRLHVPIEKIFNKSLLEKFPWAMEVPSTWEFTNVQN